MRIKSKTLLSALLAIAGLALGHTSARAVLTVQDGDVLLGFRETSSPQNAYIINLGSYTQFTNASAGSTLTFGSLSTYGADLVATFGANWNTRADLFWGAFGTYSGGGVSLYGTRQRTNANTPATAWGNPSLTVRNNTSGGINTVTNGFINNLVTTASGNTGNAGFQTGTAAGTYYAGVNSSNDFNGSSPFNGTGIEGGFSGTKVLDLFALSSSPTARLGTFTIDGASGVVTFTAVPEPSTYMLFAFAGTIFMVFLRRRRAQQS